MCASGEMDEAAFTGFLKSAFANLADVASDGAIHFIAMDWRHMGEVLEAGRDTYSGLKNLCVWAKTPFQRCAASPAAGVSLCEKPLSPVGQ